MHHSVGEGFQFGVAVGGRVENEVTWHQVLLSKSLVGKQVELIRLVPLAQGVTELSPQVKDALANQGAAVDEEGSAVEWFVGLMKLLGVGDSDVLVGGLDELLPQLTFKVSAGAVDLGGLQVLVELELVELS